MQTVTYSKHFAIRQLDIDSGDKAGQYSNEKGCFQPHLYLVLPSLKLIDRISTNVVEKAANGVVLPSCR